MVESPKLQWQYEDTNDGKPWTDADLQDLALALKDGGSIDGAADYLGRWETRVEVRKKAEELGLLNPEIRDERA